MIKFIKKIIKIIKEFDSVQQRADHAVHCSEMALKNTELARKYIKKATTVNADLSPFGHDPNIIFIAGRYRNVDYVQCYSIQHREFEHIVSELQSMKKFARIERIDAPKGFEIAVRQELKKEND
jgi:hypothetical protein